MANTPQSEKRARQNERRFAINKARRSRMKTSVKKIEEAIAAGKRNDALAAVREAEPVLMRSASKGVIAKKAASRKVSRMVARIKKMPA